LVVLFYTGGNFFSLLCMHKGQYRREEERRKESVG
jgi:hypothetical protein